MIAQRSGPIRVAHVVAGMSAAGIETWLVQVLRHIDRDRYQLDFLVHAKEECFYDAEIRRLGARIIQCDAPSHPARYQASLRRALSEHGTFDVVHSHLHHFSGLVLRVAQGVGVPVRIAHSHSDTRGNQARAGFVRRLYLRTMKRWVDRYATRGFAVSEPAGAALFPRWSGDDRWRTLYCGIDLEAMRRPLDAAALRARLGFPPDALVLGHIGTMREPKNHALLVDIAAAVMRREPRARLLLVGQGPLRDAIESRVRERGIADRVVLTGLVDDPLPYLRSAMDVFVFPSLWEGLPLALLEAQAAGLPCVISDVITTEIAVVPPLVTRLSLKDSADDWTDHILRAARETPPSVRAAALAAIEASPFNITTCVRHLEEIYAQR